MSFSFALLFVSRLVQQNVYPLLVGWRPWLLGAKGIATRSKNATRGRGIYFWISFVFFLDFFVLAGGFWFLVAFGFCFFVGFWWLFAFGFCFFVGLWWLLLAFGFWWLLAFVSLLAFGGFSWLLAFVAFLASLASKRCC